MGVGAIVVESIAWDIVPDGPISSRPDCRGPAAGSGFDGSSWLVVHATTRPARPALARDRQRSRTVLGRSRGATRPADTADRGPMSVASESMKAYRVVW